METPLVSCLVPVWNGEPYLGEAIDSILAQTYQPIEVIVVDDGSTDGTAAVATAYGERVSYVRQEHKGHVEARNLGLATARGDFIAYLDADDLWHKEKLSRQMARFAASPELGVSVTLIENFADGTLCSREEMPKKLRAGALPGYTVCSLLARREVFDRIGPFEPEWSHASDTRWFLLVRENKIPMELLEEVLVFRRVHGDNHSQHRAAASRDVYLQLLKGKLDAGRASQGTAPAEDTP